MDGLKPVSVSIPDASKLTGLSRSRLYELIGDGTLQTKKIGKRRLVPYAALERLIEAA